MLKKIIGFSLLVATMTFAGPKGGIFIPRNGGYEGFIGNTHVFFDTRAGGTMSIVSGQWPNLEKIANLDMRFSISGSSEQNSHLSQSNDKSPDLIFIEEGNDRTGIRVKFKLYDTRNSYYGHGMTEIWMYPDGQIFVTCAATFEKKSEVTEAAVHIAISNKLITEKTDAPIEIASLQQRYIFARPSDSLLPGLGIYWRTGRMEHNTFIFRSSFGLKGAPYYFRWPDYFRQAYGTGFYPDSIKIGQDEICLCWPKMKPGTQDHSSFNALFRIAVSDESGIKKFVEAERKLLALEVKNGVIHGNLNGYNDLEGVYEVRKTANPVSISFPSDELARAVRVKIICLDRAGGIRTILDGKSVVPQLASEGGIADDPLAPIQKQPEGAADMALVTAQLSNMPHLLVLNEEKGVQFAYQTRSAMRNFGLFTTWGGRRYAGFTFSLVDGHARNMRSYGRSDWALTENLLTWFSFCGYTPDQVLSNLRDFVVEKNGPDEVRFRYASVNESEGAESQYIVTVPADSKAIRMIVKAEFTTLENWNYPEAQFFDVFPFRGVWPEDWWYDEVLWVTPDGRWKTLKTVQGTFEGDTTVQTFKGGGFFALYSSDRGNMLMLVKNFSPDLPADYIICGNYIDFHMDMRFTGPDGKPGKPSKGFKASVEYELALWGNSKTTRKQLIEIGKKSIAAGRLIIP